MYFATVIICRSCCTASTHVMWRGIKKYLPLHEFYNHRAINYRAWSGTYTNDPFTQTSEYLLYTGNVPNMRAVEMKGDSPL